MQPPVQYPPKIRSSTPVNFHLSIPLLLFNKVIHTIPTNIPFLYPLAIFHLPIFTYNHPSNLHQTLFIFQPFSQFSLCQGTKNLWGLVRNDTVSISPFFLKVWKVITGLTITVSLSLRLRKLVYCK